MPISKVVSDTPYYVLKDGSRPAGPNVVQDDLGLNCLSVFGFSDKGPYDRFLKNSQQALTPYPLVKVYLREQSSASGDGLKLVVLNVAGPHEPCLSAATMASVLVAQENRAGNVTATHRLLFDEEADAYRVEEIVA